MRFETYFSRRTIASFKCVGSQRQAVSLDLPEGNLLRGNLITTIPAVATAADGRGAMKKI